MDCKTARLMFEFDRPRTAELDPLDLRALEAHIAACPDCTRVTKQKRALDEQLGQAMRAVDVPDQLRSRLLRRLAKERAAVEKGRWKRYAVGVAAVAATLLLVTGVWSLWHRATLPPLDLARLEETTKNSELGSGANKDDIKKAFHERGIEMTPPASLNYAFLAFHGMGTLEGQQVPCLVFIRDSDEANIHANALVYVVSDRDFKLSKLPAAFQWSETGYRHKVELYREGGSPDVYVIVHTGDNLNWLRQPDADAE